MSNTVTVPARLALSDAAAEVMYSIIGDRMPGYDAMPAGEDAEVVAGKLRTCASLYEWIGARSVPPSRIGFLLALLRAHRGDLDRRIREAEEADASTQGYRVLHMAVDDVISELPGGDEPPYAGDPPVPAHAGIAIAVRELLHPHGNGGPALEAVGQEPAGDLSEREMDLRDWGLLYGVAYAEARHADPDGDERESARLALAAAREVNVWWSGSEPFALGAES